MTSSNRPIGTRLNELGEKIERENDPERRYVFLLFQDLSAILYDIHKEVRESRSDHNSKLGTLEIKVNYHDDLIKDHQELVTKGETSLKWLRIIVMTLQPFLIGSMFYAYSLIAEIHDTVNQHSIILPRISDALDEHIKEHNKGN